MEVRLCKKCGFILGTRPGLKDDGGVCLACSNIERKTLIDWKQRQEWLTEYLKEHRNETGKYDVAVGVSGGKDSTAIVSRLIEKHHVPKERMLLVHMCDEFTPSNAGLYNRNNLVKKFGIDIVDYRVSPDKFIENTRKNFFEEFHPLKWVEEQLYSIPIEVSKAFGIPTLFMGENSAFEYGENEECEIFHRDSNEELSIIYMGSIWPYSTMDSLCEAKKIGFRTLADYDDWERQGSGDNFSQIDSKGYMIQLWTKFIKFGFQRVSDMACRSVREGLITREQAVQLIKDEDWRCDPLAKKDFCRTIGITQKEFDDTVDKFANRDLLAKDANGNWRRKDLL